MPPNIGYSGGEDLSKRRRRDRDVKSSTSHSSAAVTQSITGSDFRTSAVLPFVQATPMATMPDPSSFVFPPPLHIPPPGYSPPSVQISPSGSVIPQAYGGVPAPVPRPDPVLFAKYAPTMAQRSRSTNQNGSSTVTLADVSVFFFSVLAFMDLIR